jgi:glycosyltransferase involved in cell wall biosynthesis
MKLFISKNPEKKGGGSNTFASNFVFWARRRGHVITRRMQDAERIIIIANYGEIDELEKAKVNGAYIVHRIDEYFQTNEDEYRRRKHAYIKALNEYADVTIFQSNFVYQNAYPFLQPRRWEVILNGADPGVFYPSPEAGEYIGHVTWGVGIKQRLDLLQQRILSTPEERFLLVGRHKESEYNFRLPNVLLRGTVNWSKIHKEYHKMKMFYYPSQNDPCPNVVIEAILSGVPVCYNSPGGVAEIVKDCGEPLENFDHLLVSLTEYRQRCFQRRDLYFDTIAEKYMSV